VIQRDNIIRAETPPPAARRRRVDRTLKRVRFVADLLDQRFKLPGTQIRYGYDAIIGLLPGIGDTLTAVIGFYIVLEAIKHHARGGVVARMVLNLAIDWLIGLIPVADLFFDVAFKANLRNARLLEQELASRQNVIAEQLGSAGP
jgi:hypothetical protein